MPKLNLGLHFNLSKLSLLGIANVLSLPFLAIYAANGQLVSSYSCESYSSGFATMRIGLSRYPNPIINWENRQPICNSVSQRFQIAQERGNLRYLMREDKKVCGTDRYNGECNNELFSTDTAANAEGLWRKLMNQENLDPSDSIYINQSAGRVYFNLERYLEDQQRSTNQEISANQSSSQP